MAWRRLLRILRSLGRITRGIAIALLVLWAVATIGGWVVGANWGDNPIWLLEEHTIYVFLALYTFLIVYPLWRTARRGWRIFLWAIRPNRLEPFRLKNWWRVEWKE